MIISEAAVGETASDAAFLSAGTFADRQFTGCDVTLASVVQQRRRAFRAEK